MCAYPEGLDTPSYPCFPLDLIRKTEKRDRRLIELLPEVHCAACFKLSERWSQGGTYNIWLSVREWLVRLLEVTEGPIPC